MNSRTSLPRNNDTKTAAIGGCHHHGGHLPKFHTINAVAEALGISPRTVRRWIANGALATHRLGNVVRIAEADLRAFLAAHRED